MYSRTQSGRPEGVRPPQHYSGVAFDAGGQPPALPKIPQFCADGLPAAPSLPPSPPEPTAEEKSPPPAPHTAERGEDEGGLFAGIGREELLLLGIILILAQRPGEDDTILLLLLLLLRH
ncbi:MAG: hypothetical protein IKD37_02285 [Clostridia bacterium]|nr:hypothetical protein [Clostridia bacterium]